MKIMDNASGVGFRTLPEDVNKLPKFNTEIEVTHKYYEAVPKSERKELTDYKIDNNTITLNISDSKEGKISCSPMLEIA